MLKTNSMAIYKNPENAAKRIKAYQGYMDKLKQDKAQTAGEDPDQKAENENAD